MKNAPLIRSAFTLLVATLLLAGCAGRAEVFPNSDKSLRKTAAQFAADSARRFPFKTNAPRAGDAQARAQVGYTFNTLEIVNLSADTWEDVEVWVNRTHVIHIQTMEPNKLKRLPFQAIYNDVGTSFPTNNKNDLIRTVEIYTGGKMWDVRLQLAD